MVSHSLTIKELTSTSDINLASDNYSEKKAEDDP